HAMINRKRWQCDFHFQHSVLTHAKPGVKINNLARVLIINFKAKAQINIPPWCTEYLLVHKQPGG
ncbi:hypothetical protein, partial [Serratia sp. CY43514]|uniref:hypothetical protein n=1 Tax=Serratia sp. CY43514 TaxID=3383620 RepID=UPI0040277765